MSAILDSWGDVATSTINTSTIKIKEKEIKIQSWDLDSWDDDEEPCTESESSCDSESDSEIGTPIHPEPQTQSEPQTQINNETETDAFRRNPYEKYTYLIPAMEATLLKTMYPTLTITTATQELKKNINHKLEDCILCVRNAYVLPLYHVLRSTRFYNPIVKKYTNRKKNERVDPDFKWVTLEDQRKVYQLFGFMGTTHQNSQIHDDMLRDEVQEKLRDILYNANTMAELIQYLMYRMNIQINKGDIDCICQGLKQRKEYTYKSYTLPEKWYYNAAAWKKHNNYNELMILGGEGGRLTTEELINSR